MQQSRFLFSNPASFSFAQGDVLKQDYFTGPLNKQGMTIEKNYYFVETKNLFFLYPLTHIQRNLLLC